MHSDLPPDFHIDAYLALNPDLKAVGVDPVEHYLKHGRQEGRAYRKLREDEVPASFDTALYLEANPDLKTAGIDPMEHFRLYGYRESRPIAPMAEQLKPRLREPYAADGLTSIHNHDFVADAQFQTAYQRGVQAAACDYQWHWRVHIGLWAAQSAARVPGDFVECGVNRGFLSSAIMRLLDWDKTGRIFFLLDTFSGLDERFVSETEKAAGVMARNSRDLQSGFYVSSAETVRRNFSEWCNVRIIEGAIPETLGQIKSTGIAFAHIDLNCSPPEVAAIDAIWDRMPTGAVVLLDDYAYHGFQPQKEGMDAWARARAVPIASLPTGQGLMIKA